MSILKNQIDTFLKHVNIISNFITELWKNTRTQILHLNFLQSKLTLKNEKQKTLINIVTETSCQQNTAAKKNHGLISTWRMGISNKTTSIPATAPAVALTFKTHRKYKKMKSNE